MPLTSVQLAGFRLHPGPLPEHYRSLYTAPAKKHKNKHKKHKHKDGAIPPDNSILGNYKISLYSNFYKKICVTIY